MSDATPLPACPICSYLAWWTTHHPECRCCGIPAPLAPEVVAVLRAVEAFKIPFGGLAYQGRAQEAEALDEARTAWREAGRPGPPPEGKERP